MNRKIRNRLFTFHTWLGLHLSIFFAFMFLTGTLLVFGNELESIARPAVWTTISQKERTASFGMIYDSIKKAHPDSTILAIEKRPAPWFVDRTYSRTERGKNVSYWTDPKTGDVVQETADTNFRNILRDLHDTFLTTKRPVYLLICASSVLLLFQAVSGLITYRRFWKGLFRWPNRSGGLRPWAGGTHRLLAVWAVPLLVITAITSFYFLLFDLGFDGTTPKPLPPADRETALPGGFNSATIDAAEEKARAALPDFKPAVLIIPGHKYGSLNFVGHQAGFSEFSGASTVSIDPGTLEILGAFTPDDSGGMARWLHLMEVLHFGTWGGTFSKVIWFLLGLTAFGVACSGALIFAAKLTPNATNFGPVRRIWRGMGLLRWAYLVLLLGILIVAYMRFSPASYANVEPGPPDAFSQDIQAT